MKCFTVTDVCFVGLSPANIFPKVQSKNYDQARIAYSSIRPFATKGPCFVGTLAISGSLFFLIFGDG